MTRDYEALRAAWRKIRDSERYARFDTTSDVMAYAVALTPKELQALNELLAEGLTEPDHHEGNYAANLAGGRVSDHPDISISPEIYRHAIVVKDAAAVPGVQALLFLYRGVSDIEVSPWGVDRTHWNLSWSDSDRDQDLDFLRPHILPPLVR